MVVPESQQSFSNFVFFSFPSYENIYVIFMIYVVDISTDSDGRENTHWLAKVQHSYAQNKYLFRISHFLPSFDCNYNFCSKKKTNVSITWFRTGNIKVNTNKSRMSNIIIVKKINIWTNMIKDLVIKLQLLVLSCCRLSK